jgi:hypothetical protein
MGSWVNIGIGGRTMTASVRAIAIGGTTLIDFAASGPSKSHSVSLQQVRQSPEATAASLCLDVTSFVQRALGQVWHAWPVGNRQTP